MITNRNKSANRLSILALLLLSASVLTFGQAEWVTQTYNPDVPGIEENPMKGWMPGYKGINSTFPYSVDHFYIPLSDVYKGWGDCDWTAFEDELDRIVGGGRHVVTRFFIDYPNRASAMPEFLIDDIGYKVPMYDDNSPDWNDDTLMVALEEFIAMFGEAYDGDPRIAFIEAGLYGFWGEWHTYPNNSWAATQENKDRLLIAYDNAFDITHIGLRQSNHASTYDLKMSVGYYDDSFGYNTLCTGSWCSWNGNLVPDGITDNYMYHPFAGELRPELQNNIFDAWPNDSYSDEDGKIMEDLETCIRSTRLSFMKAYYLYNKIPTATEFENALKSHKMMGYEFFVSAVRLDADLLSNVTVEVKIKNTGVAPMYYNWEVEFAAINSSGDFLGVIGSADWVTNTIYPDSTEQVKSFTAPIYGNDTYTILMRFVNPLEDYTADARPLRFANSLQDNDREGWLTLGAVNVNAEEVETTGVAIEQCPEDSIRVGTRYSLSAVVSPFNATDKTVYWQSSDNAVATIDSTGRITALAVGSTTITLFSHDSTLSDVCTVNVSDPNQWPFGNVSQTLPGRIEGEFYDEGGEGVAYHDDETKSGKTDFRPGEMVDLNTHPGASNDYVVGWTADGEWLEYTVDVESGLYDITLLYYSGETPGDIKILLDNEEITTITGMENQSSWGTAATIVVPEVAITGGDNLIMRLELIGQGFDIDAIDFFLHVNATGVSIGSCPVTDLAIGATHQLSGGVEPENASDRSVSWSTSDEGIATVNAAGLVTGIAEGDAIITVTSTDGGFTDQCAVTVFKPAVPVTGVELSGCPGEELVIDETVALSATVLPSYADDPGISWSSSDDLVATVDQNGQVSAVGAGVVEISVTTNDGGFVQSCMITVSEPIVNVTGVTLEYCPADTVFEDSLFQLIAVVAPQHANDKSVSWSSSNEAVATVDNLGWVTAISAGETTITVTTTDGDFTDVCVLNVDTDVRAANHFSTTPGVRVFPNPVREVMNFIITDPGRESNLKIYNIYGKLLYSGISVEKEFSVSTAELGVHSGLYIIKVVTGDRTATFRIVAEK